MILCETMKELNNIITNLDNKNILFRGSSIYKKILYPRMYQNKKLIFATTNIYLAISYMRCIDYENKYSVSQNYNSKTNQIDLITSNINNIKEMFSCIGYIYILDKDKFNKTIFKQFKNIEYISDTIQKPILIIKIMNVYTFIKSIKNIHFYIK